MVQLLVHLFLRLLLIVMFINDLRTTHRLKQSNTTLHRVLSDRQKRERILYYFTLFIGLVVPFEWIYLVFTLLAIAYFFYFTDREIFINKNEMYFRAKAFEFKRVENLTYVNQKLEFDYQHEHIKLSRPLLEKSIIEKEIVQRVEKLKSNADKRKHKRNA